MARWTYLIPRLIIVALIGLVVWLSIDPLMRRVLIANAESITGAKVEIGQLRSNLGQGKIFLQELQIADPRNTNLNVLQADMAYLDVDVASLLRKRIKITGGRTSDVRFGSPRTEPGTLQAANAAANDTASAAEPSAHVLPQPTGRPASNRNLIPANVESQWLEQLQAQIVAPNAGDSQRELKSTATVKQMAQQWSPKLTSSRDQLQQINEQIERLKVSLGQQDSNPLRQDFESTLTELLGLIRQTDELRSNLSALSSTAENDKAKLAAAQESDQIAIQQLAKIQTFDSESMSQLLLARSQQARVDEIIQWFRWFRESVPDFENDLRRTPLRGSDIALTSINQEPIQPSFLIEQLDLEGAGHFAGRYLNFAGRLNHFSSHPQLHAEPISFDVRAQGKQHFVVKCEIDRRQGFANDSLEVRCPDLDVEQPPLGSDRSILVTVGPNMRLQADVRLKAIGDQLSGDLVFRHSNVSLHVDHLHSLAGGTEMALRLNQELSANDQFVTRVSLSGTLDHYVMQLESDLGDQFAASMNRVSSEIQRQHLNAQNQRLQEIGQTQVTKLTTEIDGAINQLMHDTQNSARWLEQTREQISSTANAAWPAIR